MTAMDEISSVLPYASESTPEETWDILRQRVTVLSTRVWEGRTQWPEIQTWLDNFDGRSGIEPEVERLHALYLLSQFLFIGSIETRVLLQAIYRDLFLIPLVQEIRGGLGGTRDWNLIKDGVDRSLQKTRFLGVGNPSESGVHLLYYFRQENQLSRDLFLDSAAMFMTTTNKSGELERSLSNPDIERYVFVDDVCGSGVTAKIYSDNILTELLALKPDAKLSYLAMFATADGINQVRTETKFGHNSGAVFELDETYKCLSDKSRILRAAPPHIDRDSLRKVALHYGNLIWPEHPSGYEDNQLLLGFHHNTPDNTLPVIWFDGTNSLPWTPAFKRYPKIS